MAEPILDPTTERVYQQLPQHYRDSDALQDFQLKRYLGALLSSQDTVNNTIDRLTYLSPDEGGSPDDTSEMVDPNVADESWLRWLGQLFGLQITGEITDNTRNEIINASSFKAGTTDSIIAAAQSVLVGTKKVQVIKHADDSWQPDMTGVTNTASYYDMLIRTLQSETLKNLLPSTLSKTLTPSTWDAEYRSAGYDSTQVQKELVEQPDVFQNRALAFYLKDPTWQASATIAGGFGNGPFGSGTFGYSSEVTSQLRFLSHSSISVTPTDSYQYMVSLGLRQDILDKKRSAIGFQFLDADGDPIQNASKTNLYPDPGHDYGLNPFTSTATSGTGTIALDTSRKRNGAQSVSITNQTPLTTVATNLAPNPYFVPSNVGNWTIYAGTPASFSLGSGDTYNGRLSLRNTCNNLTGANRLGIRTANGVAAAQPNLVAGNTYFFSADVFVSSDAATPNWQLIFRDDPNNDSAAVTAASGYSLTGVGTLGSWYRITTKFTVNAGRTVTGIYIVGSNATQTSVGAYMQTVNWMIEQTTTGSTSPSSYFDGSTPAGGGYQYYWTGATGASTSIQGTPATGTVYKNTTSGTFGTPASYGLDIGDYVTGSAWLYLPTGITAPTVALAITGTAFTATASILTPTDRDKWVQIVTKAQVANPSGTMNLRIYSGNKSGDIINYDDFGFAIGDEAVDFNGDMAPSADGIYTYGWSGTPGASPSNAYQDVFSTEIDVTPVIQNTSVVSHNYVKSSKATNYSGYGSNSAAINISNFGKYEDGDIIRASINTVASTSDFGLYITPTFGLGTIPAGTTFTFTLDLNIDNNANVDSLRVFFRDDNNSDNDAATFVANTPASVSVTKGRWHTRSWTATVNPNRNVTSAYVVIESSVNQSQGVYIDTANWLIEDGATSNSYFNGDTPSDDLYTYQWDGIPNASITNKVLNSVAASNVVKMQQFNTRFTAPAGAVTAKVFIDMDGFNGKDTLYIAQPAVREEEDTIWIAESADPLKAIIEKNAKPAGIILHWKPLVSDWDTITANGTRTWDDLNLKWTDLEELGE